ncbi:MAG: CDC27 family protein [Saprospiraceae bacterium]
MEQIDQTLIERYLSRELTPAERNELERREGADPEFRKELNKYRLSFDALKLSQREELKNRFRQRDKMLDQKGNPGASGTKQYVLMMVAAGIISILIAWYFLYTPDRTSDQAKNDSKDSIQIVQSPPVIIDTIKTNPIKIKETEEKEPVKSKNNGQQIFAENFEPYKDESMDPTSRSGEEDLTPRDKFLLSYWDGNSNEAQVAFNTMSPADRQNDNYRFIYANVLMSLNKTYEAGLILTGVQQNHKSMYAAETRFYLGLCNLKAGKVEEARKNLEAYLLEKDVQNKVKAKKMLDEMN